MSILNEVGQGLQDIGKGGIVKKLIDLKGGRQGLGLLETAYDKLSTRQPIMSRAGGGGGLFGGLFGSKTILPSQSPGGQSEYVPPIGRKIFEL